MNALALGGGILLGMGATIFAFYINKMSSNICRHGINAEVIDMQLMDNNGAMFFRFGSSGKVNIILTLDAPEITDSDGQDLANRVFAGVAEYAIENLKTWADESTRRKRLATKGQR